MGDVKAIERKHRCIAIVDPAEWQTRAARNLSTKHPRLQDYATNTTLTLHMGDITTFKASVLVTSTATRLMQTGRASAITKTLYTKAGIELQAAFNATVAGMEPKPGNVFSTPGFNLDCKEVYHAVLTDYDSKVGNSKLAETIHLCLSMAESSSYSSIAFPVLGGGGFGYPPCLVMQTFHDVVQNFKTRTLRKITIVIFPSDKTCLQATQKEFNFSFASQHERSTSFTFQSGTSGSNLRDSEESGEFFASTYNAERSVGNASVSILLCSDQENNGIEAQQSTDEIAKDLTLTKKIEDEVLRELTLCEEIELLDISRKHKAIIERIAPQSFNDVTSLVVAGLNSNVFEARNDALNLIHQLKNALVCSQYVKWKYKTERGKMENFPLRASHDLEQAYKNVDNGVQELHVSFKNCKKSLIVDFSQMTATCRADGSKISVERCTLSGVKDTFPPTWDDMGGHLWKNVAVKRRLTEYLTVMQKFNATSQINVLKLERIQNPTLYKQFQAQKTKVADRMTQSGSTLPVTLELFHGTSDDVCSNIFIDGFDRSHAGKNASRYGKGVYFATTSKYSACYAKPDPQGEKRMFLADVITGEYCQGHKSMKTVPIQSSGSPYDSLVDKTASPSMYIVFKDASAYPFYMLTFI